MAWPTWEWVGDHIRPRVRVPESWEPVQRLIHGSIQSARDTGVAIQSMKRCRPPSAP